MDWISTLGMMLLVFVLGYFMLVRPMRKRQAEMTEMASKMEPGTRVLLTSGIFGTVKHVGDRQIVVELAPEVDVTVVKQAVAKLVTPDEEEFEYDDAPGGFEAYPTSVEPAAPLDPALAPPAQIIPAAESGMFTPAPAVVEETVTDEPSVLVDDDLDRKDR